MSAERKANGAVILDDVAELGKPGQRDGKIAQKADTIVL